MTAYDSQRHCPVCGEITGAWICYRCWSKMWDWMIKHHLEKYTMGHGWYEKREELLKLYMAQLPEKVEFT